MKFVIGGTGRSGTKWCATAMRNAGIMCGHEQVFATAMLPNMDIPRILTWEGDSSLAAVPYFRTLRKEIRKILVVREPYSFVSSILKAGPLIAGSQPAGLNQYLDKRYPEIRQAPNEVEAALTYWLYWNVEGATYADVIFRIEDLRPEELYEAARVTPRWPTYHIGIVNSSPDYARGRYTLNEVSEEVIKMVNEQAEKFGYETWSPS